MGSKRCDSLSLQNEFFLGSVVFSCPSSPLSYSQLSRKQNNN